MIPGAEGTVASGRREAGPWGPGMTLIFGGVLFLGYSLVQGAALFPLMLARAASGASPAEMMASAMTGMNLALATLAACPFMLAACTLLVLARRGPTIESYLALRPVRIRVVAGWVAVIGVTGLGVSFLNELLERPAPEFIARTYETAGYLPLFWAGVAVCAPLSEEVLFRGFLFPGLLASRLRGVGTVLLSAGLFAGVHAAQYDWYDLAQVGLVGGLFGWARLGTGSLVVPIAMHVALNHLALALFHFESAGRL